MSRRPVGSWTVSTNMLLVVDESAISDPGYLTGLTGSAAACRLRFYCPTSQSGCASLLARRDPHHDRPYGPTARL